MRNEYFSNKQTIWFKNPDTGQKELIEIDEQEIQIPPSIKRMLAYHVGEQLNFLYDDIQAGLFGEEAKTGQFAQYVKRIKNEFPKP